MPVSPTPSPAPPAPVGPFEVATFVLAVIGLVVALASLVWQIIAWLFAGSRVRVRVGYAYAVPNLQPGLSLEAFNRGRTDVAINGWGFLLPNGHQVFPTMGNAWVGPSTPHTLAAGHSVTWYSDRAAIANTLQAKGVNAPLKGFVSLGTGKRAVSRRTVQA